MIKQITLASIFLLSLAITSTASAGIIVDFTFLGPGGQQTVNNAASQNPAYLTFSTQDPTGTGVSFDVTASAIIPAGGGANNGNIRRNNGGLGSTVENGGQFLNVIGGVSEELKFDISNVMGLAPGETLQIESLLSQNLSSMNPIQAGGFSGTFGHNVNDSITLNSDSGLMSVVNQSDTGDMGSILLVGNNGNNNNTGNTFAHDAGNLDFSTSFTLAQTNLNRNDAVVIQGFKFAVVPAPVVPEPTSALAFLSLLGVAVYGRRRSS